MQHLEQLHRKRVIKCERNFHTNRYIFHFWSVCGRKRRRARIWCAYTSIPARQHSPIQPSGKMTVASSCQSRLEVNQRHVCISHGACFPLASTTYSAFSSLSIQYEHLMHRYFVRVIVSGGPQASTKSILNFHFRLLQMRSPNHGIIDSWRSGMCSRSARQY